jgi:NAD(P)-dependent dehydrogenase (short-subunit alcohol dehydrogenase family)
MDIALSQHTEKQSHPISSSGDRHPASDENPAELADQVALVTGGSRGIGREIALAFAKRGASVVIASRKADACEQFAAEITDLTGRKAVGLGCHVGRWQECDELTDTVYERFGRCDILVNNAGMSPPYTNLVSVSEELWDKVLAVNLKSAFRLSSLIGERMAGSGGGSIINISSIAAVQPKPHDLPYAIAKAGLNALTQGIARAYAPTVRANTIMLGPFLTDIAKAWDIDEFNEHARRDIALRRAGEPSEVVGAALYLAGPGASYTTGCVIKIDGGAAWPAA